MEVQEIRAGECDCDTSNPAIIWCYVHGYLIKPPVVYRNKFIAPIPEPTPERTPVVVVPEASSKKEHARPVVAAEPFLRSEQTLDSAPQPAAHEIAETTSEPQNGSLNGQTVTDNLFDGLQPADSKGVADALFSQSAAMAPEYQCAPETPVEPSVTDKPRRRRNPWKAYSKPERVKSSTDKTVEPTDDRPERARTARSKPLHNAAYVPGYVKLAKIREQGDGCIYCERLFGSPILRGDKIEILEPQAEHFTPRSASGRTTDGNLSYACHVCNGLKSDYLFETVDECRVWLEREWPRKGYTSCPPLIPFKMAAMTAASYN